MIEKKLRAVSPQAFTADGDNKGRVTLADATLFKVEQEVILKATGEANLKLIVKDIPDKNTLIVGPKDEALGIYSDISAYTTAKDSSVEASLQVRPVVLDQDVQRSTYEEAPTVARRVYLVDVLGRGINSANPLPVEATIAMDDVDNVARYRKTYTNANVEESQALPPNTKKLYVSVVDQSGKMRLSFTSGGTNANDYITVGLGNSYWREGLNLTGKTLYYQVNKSNVVVEIEAWF